MTPLHQIKLLALYQVAVGAAGIVLAVVFGGVESAASFAVGTSLSLASVLLLAWALWRVFTQKSIAWTVALIISKYALLLSSIFYLTRAAWFDQASCGLGIASFIIPALLVAVFEREKESSRGTSSL